LDSDESWYDVPLSVESTVIPVVKPELVDTCKRYEVAPVEVLQVREGLVEIPVAPLDGDESVGGD
jgi:hypothetical protein